MGFINRGVQNLLRYGKKAKHVMGKSVPYLKAAANTVINNPEFVPQLAGLATTGATLAAEVSGAVPTGGMTVPQIAATGGALFAAGGKTFGDISKAYKQELRAAKSRRGQKKMSPDDVAKLKEARATIGKKKRVMRDRDNVNVND